MQNLLILTIITFAGMLGMNAQELGPAPFQLMPEQANSYHGPVFDYDAHALLKTGGCNRQTIINNYNNVYLPTAVSNAELAWTGSTATCTPGTTSALSINRTLQRINYYRELVCLPGNITFDQPSYEAACQAASLIMDAENNLSHFPPNTWACWTNLGSTTAGQSNLALGVHSAAAITGYMAEPGGGNGVVGHRRWILYSRASVFGTGSTSDGGANALKVIGTPTTNSATLPDFIAYPPEGYVPRSLISFRWSFGIPGADFNSATVTVTDETGNAIALTQNAVAVGYGDNTIVWEMPIVAYSGSEDVAYNVTISGVGNAPQASYSYTVVAIEEVTPTLTFDRLDPTCTNNGSITANYSAGAVNYLWNNGATSQTVSGLVAGNYSVTITDKNGCTVSASTSLVDNSAAAPQPGNGTPATLQNLTGTGNLNISTTGTVTGTNEVLGWWITKGSAISDMVSSQASLDAAVAAANIQPANDGAAINTNPSVVFMDSDLAGGMAYDCSNLEIGATYYATPLISSYIPSIPDASCIGYNGTVNNITFNGYPGKYTFLPPNAIGCRPNPLNGLPTYTISVNVSGYTGTPGQLCINVRDDGFSGGTIINDWWNAGNGTYTYTQNDVSNYSPNDPGDPSRSSGLTFFVWQQGGNGMQNATVSISLNITYPGTPGISFPTINYSNCVFGSPVTFSHCSAPSAIPPGAAGTLYTANYSCTEASGWINYWYDNGVDQLLLLSLKPDPTDNNFNVQPGDVQLIVGATEVEAIDGNASTTDYTSNPDGWYCANRYWEVNPTGQPENGKYVAVRSYFNTSEYTSVQTAVAANNGSLSSMEEMIFYKVLSADAPNDHYNITPAEILLYDNGTPMPGNTKWSLGASNGNNYAEYYVSSFSGGGGGSGGGTSFGPLPLELLTFDGVWEGQKAKLNWSTSLEKNLSHFEVEHSPNGKNFKAVGEVVANNNQDGGIYEFMDRPTATQNYYRLRIVDLDDTYSYSNIIVLNSDRLSDLTIFPNPNNGASVLLIEHNRTLTDVQVEVMSINGQVISSQIVPLKYGQNQIPISMQEAASGVYFVKITRGNDVEVFKMNKL